MEDNRDMDEGNLLAGYLEEFKILEKNLPEVAQRLSFAGYVQYATLSLFGNEQYELLERIAEGIDALKKQVGSH